MFTVTGPLVTLAGPIGVMMGILLLSVPFFKSDLDDPVGLDELGLAPIADAYDYVIVGAGSAGAVLANRLSARRDLTVLLLEAGGDGNLLSEVPFLAGTSLGTDMDWHYTTEPDGRSCLSMKDGRCVFHRGRVAGGSSVVNGLIYTRGNREDFDAWARAGNEGWSYEDVLPYFKRSEDQLDPERRRDFEFHGRGGLQPVSASPYKSGLAAAFLRAARELGFTVGDTNAENQFQFDRPSMIAKNGRRYSTAKAFLGPAKDRTNLRILLKAHVMKVMVNNYKRAEGVIFKRHGKIRSVRARREVILCGGTIASPQLLMLSGIGPKKHLEHHGIRVVRNLPVGDGMQSHVGTCELVFTAEAPVTINPLRLITRPSELLAYFSGKGVLASPNGFEGYGFVRTGVSPEAWPDVELIVLGAHVASDGGFLYRNVLNLRDAAYDKFAELQFREGFTLIPYLLHPKSRGRVRLRNSNPFSKPVIEANFFDDPRDVKAMIAGIKLALAMGETRAMKRLGARFFDKPNPFCKNFAAFSDPYWECVLRHFTYTIYHDTGTCKMGPASDPWAVVGPDLRVHGVEGLRVADSSVMPEIPSAHTHAACIMVGERAADLILKSNP